jgi:cold shock CspA family protein
MSEEVGRLSGVVAGVVAEKNYGFISPDDNGPQLFFHRTAYGGDFELVRPGRRVTYIPVVTDKGVRAVAVEDM